MRILQVVHDFLPRHVAGVEVYTDGLSRALAREHDVALMFSEVVPEAPNHSLRRSEHRGLPTYEIVNNHVFRRFEEIYSNPKLDETMKEVLDEFCPDVVHLQHLINLSIGFVDEVQARGIPIVMTLHDHWFVCAHGGQRFHREQGRCDVIDSRRCGECTAHMQGVEAYARGVLQERRQGRPPRRRMGGRARAVATKLATRAAARMSLTAQRRRVEARWSALKEMADRIDLFIAPSEYLGRELGDWGLDQKRICVSDYGFEVDGFAAREDLPEVARRFAFVGSLIPHKGVHVLIEAFNGMPEDAQLEICGWPNYHPEYYEILVEAADHPGSRFVGGIEPAGIARFLSQVDVLVVPSIWEENSPLTIHEAFLAGVPVVASRMGGHQGLLGEGAGLLYDPDDASALRDNLMRLYAEPGLCKALAGAAPAVKPMSEHAIELASRYRALVSKRRSRSA